MTSAPSPGERDRAEIQAAIGRLFGEGVELASAYAAFLSTDGITRGVIGPREADRIWERHLLNSAVVATLIPVGARVVDLGSGAGLPGIPLAIARPDLQVVLLEPMLRRVRFLRDCLEMLGITNAQVHHGRAEAGVTPLADIVVVRAVASLEALIRLSFGMLIENGVLLALKGASATGELDQVRQMMTLEAQLLTLEAPGQPALVVRVVRPTILPTAAPTKIQRPKSARRSR